MVEIVRFADDVAYHYRRLATADITELQNTYNVNLCDDNGETWFDEEIPAGYTSIIDEDEFFNRYFGESYDC
jgi:hypothetical protein